jgi:membrane-associated phospholipid phosphatase
MSPPVRAVDVAVAGYNLVLATLWLTQLGRGPLPVVIGAAHLAAAALPFLFQRWNAAASSRPIRLLRDLYPLVFLALFWSELGLLFELRHPLSQDTVVVELDLALFGQHLNLHWMPLMPWPWFSEVMHFVYLAYYGAVFLPPLYLLVRAHRPALDDTLFRILATYLSCYLFYLVFPVIGPAELLPQHDGALTQGFFYQLTHAARAAGDSLGTAFPSSHVAGAVTAAIVGARWFPPFIARLLLVEAVGVVAATVYTQNHYAIDAVAGIVWAVGLQLALIPLARRLHVQPVTVRVPLLPLPFKAWPAAARSGGGAS